jgi:DNA-binding FadR family transcriptional regulator
LTTEQAEMRNVTNQNEVFGLRRPVKVAEWLARELVRDIASRKLEPGTVLLSESAAIERYKVSRGSLREALRLLEEQGLVVVKPGIGPMVAQVTAADLTRMTTFFYHVNGVTVRQLIEARCTLDPLLVRVVTERQDPSAMERVRELLAEEPTTREARAAHEIEFHSLLINVGNPLIDLFAETLQLLYADRVQSEHHGTTGLGLVHGHHHAIALAVLDGDADRAERLMREHVNGFMEWCTTQMPHVLGQLIDWR